MARRSRGKGPRSKQASRQEQPQLPAGLTIRFDGPQGSGKTTAMNAVRLLLEDAGATVGSFVDPRWPGDGERNVLVAALAPDDLAELRAWMEDEPA